MPVLKAHDLTLHHDFPEQWSGEFSFVQGADCQFGMQWTQADHANYAEALDKYSDQCTWEKEIEWCIKFVDQINEMPEKPLFAVMCGDMLDAFPDRFPEKRTEQKVSFDEVFSRLDIPLVCVCGNHDVGNAPTVETVDRYRNEFGDDWFSFVCSGVFFICLNSQYLHDGQHVPELVEEHAAWLEDQLALVKERCYKHSIIFQHIPWFLVDPEEDEQYFNITQPARREWLERFRTAGVTKVFCGHYHRNAGGWYKELEVVVTSAVGTQLGKDRSGFRVVRVGEDGVEHEYINIEGI